MDHVSVKLPHPKRRVRDDRPFIGSGLRDVWSHFETQLLEGIRRSHPYATLAVNKVLVLIDADGTQVSELARRAGVTKQAMAETVHTLEELGLVRREDDASDRRARIVLLTGQGWIAIRDGLSVAENIQRDWTALLGERDMHRLISVLDRLSQKLDAGKER